MGTMSERDVRRAWGMVVILGILALVGWGVYESMDEESTVTGEEISDEQVTEEQIEEAQESNLRQTQTTEDTSYLY